MSSLPQLPEDVRAALARGETIEALKRLRAATGLGLQEAKYLLDRYQQQPARELAERAVKTAIPASVRNALAAGNKIEAIRLFREHAGVGLKEAKDAVDELERRGGFYNPSLAPGEVPAPNRWLWLLVAIFLFAAGAVGYYLFLM